MTALTPPHSEQELLERANAIAGLTLAEIAAMHNLVPPLNLKRNKGWVGILIEQSLGAQAGSKAEQDFQHLNIELKTIPIDKHAQPLETTFVSLAPTKKNSGVTWENSHVRQKLKKVLWIPVEGKRTIPLAERKVGIPILWQPSIAQEIQLKNDWEELMEMITLGKFNQINASFGKILQLRPKGANRLDRTQAYDQSGKKTYTLPLGFYLRRCFTAQIIRDFLEK